MHFEFQFLDIFFNLTIFSLLSYKFVSFARKYLIPYLRKEIKIEQDTRLDLIEKENILISSQHKVETQIRHQHTLFNLLEKNVQSWQMFLQTQKNTKEAEFNKIKIAADQKYRSNKKTTLLYAQAKMYSPMLRHKQNSN